IPPREGPPLGWIEKADQHHRPADSRLPPLLGRVTARRHLRRANPRRTDTPAPRWTGKRRASGRERTASATSSKNIRTVEQAYWIVNPSANVFSRIRPNRPALLTRIRRPATATAAD